jgi:hypothetical protein
MLASRFSVVDLNGLVTVVGTLIEPTLPDATGGGLYKISLNTTSFPTSDG